MGSQEAQSYTDPVEELLLELVDLLELDEVLEVETPQTGVVDEVLELVVLELELEVVEVDVEYDPSVVPHCGEATAEPASARATTAAVNFILMIEVGVFGGGVGLIRRIEWICSGLTRLKRMDDMQ